MILLFSIQGIHDKPTSGMGRFRMVYKTRVALHCLHLSKVARYALSGLDYFHNKHRLAELLIINTGAARVRDIFQEARKHSPFITFIDEIDAVGGQRGRTLNCERDQTLNQLFTEMDGFDKDESVVVMAATNQPETLDSALMRPGRFSRKVLVGEPDEEGRRKIFALYMRDVPMKEDKEAICSLVASLTPGLVGTDLENIANESVLLAARRDGDFVTSDDVLQVVERATKKIYDDAGDAKETKPPYSSGSIAQAPAPTTVVDSSSYRQHYWATVTLSTVDAATNRLTPHNKFTNQI